METSERSGGQHRITSKKGHDPAAHHQPTAATDYYAQLGDPNAQGVLRKMYDPTPGISPRVGDGRE